jgi:hypothetical protein
MKLASMSLNATAGARRTGVGNLVCTEQVSINAGAATYIGSRRFNLVSISDTAAS